MLYTVFLAGMLAASGLAAPIEERDEPEAIDVITVVRTDYRTDLVLKTQDVYHTDIVYDTRVRTEYHTDVVYQTHAPVVPVARPTEAAVHPTEVHPVTYVQPEQTHVQPAPKETYVPHSVEEPKETYVPHSVEEPKETYVPHSVEEPKATYVPHTEPAQTHYQAPAQTHYQAPAQTHAAAPAQTHAQVQPHTQAAPKATKGLVDSADPTLDFE